MKYITLLLLTFWGIYTFTNNSDLRPSDDICLWLLSAFTFVGCVVNWIILLWEWSSNTDKNKI